MDTPNTSITKENDQSLPTQSQKAQSEEIKEESHSVQSGDIEDSLASNSQLNITPKTHDETITNSPEMLELSALEEKKAIRLNSLPSEDTLCPLSEEPIPALEETVLENTVSTPITQRQYTALTLEQLQQQAQHRIQQHEKTIQQLKQDMAHLSLQQQHFSERIRYQPSSQGLRELANISRNLQAYRISLQQAEQSLLSEQYLLLRLQQQATQSTQTLLDPQTATAPISYRPIIPTPSITSTLPSATNYYTYYYMGNVGVSMHGHHNTGIEQGDHSSIYGKAPAPDS